MQCECGVGVWFVSPLSKTHPKYAGLDLRRQECAMCHRMFLVYLDKGSWRSEPLNSLKALELISKACK